MTEIESQQYIMEYLLCPTHGRTIRNQKILNFAKITIILNDN